MLEANKWLVDEAGDLLIVGQLAPVGRDNLAERRRSRDGDGQGHGFLLGVLLDGDFRGTWRVALAVSAMFTVVALVPVVWARRPLEGAARLASAGRRLLGRHSSTRNALTADAGQTSQPAGSIQPSTPAPFFCAAGLRRRRSGG